MSDMGARLKAAEAHAAARREPGAPETLCTCGHPRGQHRKAIGKMDDGCNHEDAANGQGGAGDFCSCKKFSDAR
jgi:hypothetical protein